MHSPDLFCLDLVQPFSGEPLDDPDALLKHASSKTCFGHRRLPAFWQVVKFHLNRVPSDTSSCIAALGWVPGHVRVWHMKGLKLVLFCYS